ncbi:MAG: hypothetical protein NC121_03695 [Blautia sp.]|nr:hypothetical protein [Blautia sp.]
MKIYITENKSEAEQLRQLFKLNAECAGVHFSRTITDIPDRVMEALGTIELFVESRAQEWCDYFDELNEDEEEKIFSLIHNNPKLGKNLGTGVITCGEQANEVKNLIASCDGVSKILKAFETGKNIVLL